MPTLAFFGLFRYLIEHLFLVTVTHGKGFAFYPATHGAENCLEASDYISVLKGLLGFQCEQVRVAWGDLNFSARELVERVRQRADEVELIPGISSVQMACVRLGLQREESIFLTLHAREGYEESLEEAADVLKASKRNLIMLPRPFDIMPADVARLLSERGISPETSVHVLQRLSLPDESIKQFTLASLSEETTEFSDLSILVFPKQL